MTSNGSSERSTNSPSIAIAYAYRETSDPDRLEAKAYVDQYYHQHCQISIFADAGGALFRRGASFNLAANILHTYDVIVCTNTDVVVPWQQVLDAATLAAEHQVTVYPFTQYRELNAGCTAAWLDGDESCTDSVLVMGEQCVGPVFCVNPQAYLEAGGCDPRFEGWGFEDIAWEATAATLLGPPRRVRGWATHLYHQPDPNSYVNAGGEVYQANSTLAQRYLDAKWDADLIRTLIAER